MCDGTLSTEYFADGTTPGETCDVHYQGSICQYCGLPATEFCPFKIDGILELTPIEDASLQSGSATTAQVTNPDGTVSTVTIPANQTNLCPHTAEFMSTPGWEMLVEQQRNEIIQRDLEAQQQAALEAQQAAMEAQQQEAPHVGVCKKGVKWNQSHLTPFLKPVFSVRSIIFFIVF